MTAPGRAARADAGVVPASCALRPAPWLAAGLLAALLPVARAYDWTELGPAPITGVEYTGRVSAVACSRVDANRYFVGGADGGVWRTTDGGASWTPLTDRMPCSAIGALAIDPRDDNVIYAGTGEANFANHSRYGCGIYKSTDGGESWIQLAESTFAGRCFSKIVIDPVDTRVLYAAVTRAGGFPELAAAKNHPQRLGPVGVFKSLDGGQTWTQLVTGLPSLSATDIAIHPTNPQIVYAGIGHIFGDAANGVYRSTDGGATWTRLAGGLPTEVVGRISVAVAPSRPERVYALITRPASASGGNASLRGGFRSDNGGETWTALAVPSDLQATYGWYLSFITVKPDNADTVFMAGLNFVRSTNAGASWSNVTPPHVDMHGADWDAAGRLIVGDDGGVHVSSNLGSLWTARNDGLALVQFYPGLSTHPTNELTFYGGTQDNGTNRRSSDSRDWTQVFGGDGGWTQVDGNNPQRVFAEYQGSGNLFVSTNGGNTFNFSGTGISTSDRNCFLPPYLIDPTNPARMLYGTQRVWRSTNSGANWTALSGDLTGGTGAIRTLAFAPSNPSVVYAATTDGRVSRSANGGQTWQVILSGNHNWPRTTRELFVHPTEPDTVYLAVGQFGAAQVRRTIDGGQSWQDLDANFPDLPANTIAVDVRGGRPAIYVGADDGVYRSLDEGGSWQRLGRGLPRAAVTDLRIEPGRNRLIAATMGRGMWSVPIAVVGDMNGDGVADNFDIDAFVLALTDRAAYLNQYPFIDPDVAGDADGDGALTNFDIDGFVALLG